MGETVYGQFATVAERRGDAPAMTGGGRTWSYRELHEETERLAQGYADRGLRPGDAVAVFSSNHPAIPLLWLGCARSGVVASAVNFMLRPKELAWMLGNVAPRILVVGPDQLDVAREALRIEGLEPQLFVAAEDAVDGVPPWTELFATQRYRGELPRPEDVIEVTFTSGTTRNPKGAVFTNAAHHYSLNAWIDGMQMCDDEVVYTVMPLFHAGGLRTGVLVTLLSGGRIIVGDAFHASTFWKECVEQGVTQFTFVETILVLLLKQEHDEHERRHRMRVAIGPAQPELLARAEERYGLTTVQGYGMTEISLCCLTPLDMSRTQLQELRAAHPDATFIGSPLGHETELRLVDEHGKEVPEGEVGEFLMRSPGMLDSYINDPDATAEFLHGGWIHSGDLGIQGPGEMRYYVDRKKDMIRRGGENFAPREVEDVLMSHPAVGEVTVVAVPDEIRIEEAKAILVRKEGAALSAPELWEYCAEHLAGFKIPRYVEFRAAITRNATGRALKNELRKEPLAGEGETYDRDADGARVPA